MKVLLLNKYHYKKGGSETYYFTLGEALEKSGHTVCYFAMQDEKNVECKQAEYFVSNKSYNGGIKGKISMVKNIAYSKEAYKKLDALLEKEKPDLAVLNLVHRQITLSVIDALKKHNVKIVWTMHDLITICPNYTMLDNNGQICEKCSDGKFKYCIKNKCVKGSTLMSVLAAYEANVIKRKKWYNDVDLYVCPSEFYMNKLQEANFTKSKIVCLRNPLPINTKYEVSGDVEDYILYFGRLSKEKGVKTLIDAMKNINYKLVILGTGPIEDELKNYVLSNNINNVEFKGFQKGEALQNYIRKAKCVVLPSQWYENGPYSAMEALALGKPLIVSNYGGLPELVENEKNGYIYDTVEELEESIKKIISLDKQTYSAMSQESHDRACRLFEPYSYVENLLKNI